MNLVNPYIFGNASTLVLDQVPSALAMWSLRKGRAADADFNITVKDMTTNLTRNIGFSGEGPDEVDILDLCGSHTGRITQIRDKSGNGNHATAVGLGAIICESGSIIKVNGKAAPYYPPGESIAYEAPSGLLNAKTAISFLFVGKLPNNAGSNAGIFAPSTTNSNGFEFLHHKVVSIPTLLRINGVDRTGAAGVLLDDNAQSLAEVYGNSSGVSAYKNNAAVTLSAGGALPSLGYSGIYALGRYNEFNYAPGYYQECIIYDTYKAADRAILASNTNTYYSIY